MRNEIIGAIARGWCSPKNSHKEMDTTRELFREVKGDYYSPSLHVTIDGLIGINVGGSVHVMSLRDWHQRAETFLEIGDY